MFLEGPIQTGKSTLIREILGEHLKDCGGFASQRLVDSAGQTRGFRIGPAAETPLTAPLGSLRPGAAQAVDPAMLTSTPGAEGDPMGPVSAAVQPTFLLTAPDGSVYPGVFKYFDRMGLIHTDQEIFDVLGTFYLISSRNRPLVLLDEIGGAELLSEPFRMALYDLLASDVPCLGVIKLAENARRMQRAYGFRDGEDRSSAEPSIVDLNLQLRQRITEELGGEILYYERAAGGAGANDPAAGGAAASGSAVRAALMDFVRDIW